MQYKIDPNIQIYSNINLAKAPLLKNNALYVYIQVMGLFNMSYEYIDVDNNWFVENAKFNGIEINADQVSRALTWLKNNNFINIEKVNSRRKITKYTTEIMIGDFVKSDNSFVKSDKTNSKSLSNPTNSLSNQAKVHLYNNKENNNINNNNKKKNSVSVLKNDKQAVFCFTLLKNRTLKNYPFMNNPKYFKDDDIDIISKMNRLDGLTYEQIEYIIKWACDHKFWKMQIRSASNLRKHAITMIAQIKGDVEEKDNKVVFIS